MKNKQLSKHQFISKIKEKRELKGVTDSVVQTALEETLTSYNLRFENLSPSERRLILKEVRAKLRRLTGQYRIKAPKDFSQKSIQSLLQSHSSTAERIDFYPILKEKISKLKPKSIRDLGCGLNPLALAKPGQLYLASDINETDLEIIKSYFNEKEISGKAEPLDIRNLPKNLEPTDLCLIFKVLDLIDKDKTRITKSLLQNIPSKYLIISFSTTKLSGKHMSSPKRQWFERLLEQLKLKPEIFESTNEKFYLIKGKIN